MARRWRWEGSAGFSPLQCTQDGDGWISCGRHGGRTVKRRERRAPVLPDAVSQAIFKTMSTQEILVEEIKHQPETVLREVLHYMKFLERRRAEEQWADVLPSREVEQEVLDILDAR